MWLPPAAWVLVDSGCGQIDNQDYTSFRRPAGYAPWLSTDVSSGVEFSLMSRESRGAQFQVAYTF